MREDVEGRIEVLARLKSEVVPLGPVFQAAVRQILEVEPFVASSLGRSHRVDAHGSDGSFDCIVGLVPPDGPDEDVDKDGDHAGIVQECQALILDPHNLRTRTASN